jgi:hypothetical protein
MPVLKSLSFTAMPKTTSDPVQILRAKFIAKLEEQKAILQDLNFIRTVQRSEVVDGQKQLVAKQQRVKPWWRTDASGQIVMAVKFGAKPIEFEKGKAGIAVSSKDKLGTVINTLIEAVRAGELDELLAQASSGQQSRRRRPDFSGRGDLSFPGPSRPYG